MNNLVQISTLASKLRFSTLKPNVGICREIIKQKVKLPLLIWKQLIQSSEVTNVNYMEAFQLNEVGNCNWIPHLKIPHFSLM